MAQPPHASARPPRLGIVESEKGIGGHGAEGPGWRRRIDAAAGLGSVLPMREQRDEQAGRRGRRRPGAGEVSHAVFDRTSSYRRLRNPFQPMKVFSADARARYARAGALVDESTLIVRFDRGLV